MKRFALVFAVLGTLVVFGSTSSVNAAGRHGRHRFTASPSYTHGYSGYAHSSGQVYVGHGYATPTYGHGVYTTPGYGGHGYSGYGYSPHNYYGSYGHGGGLRISTPHFGLQIGH